MKLLAMNGDRRKIGAKMAYIGARQCSDPLKGLARSAHLPDWREIGANRRIQNPRSPRHGGRFGAPLKWRVARLRLHDLARTRLAGQVPNATIPTEGGGVSKTLGIRRATGWAFRV